MFKRHSPFNSLPLCSIVLFVLSGGGLCVPTAAQTLPVVIPCLGSIAECAGTTYVATANGADFPATCSGRVCRSPVPLSVSYSHPPCDPMTAAGCAVTATVDVEFPGNHANDTAQCGSTCTYARLNVYRGAVGVPSVISFGSGGNPIKWDFGRFTMNRTVSCQDNANWIYRVDLESCPDSGSCKVVRSLYLDFAAELGCVQPLLSGCADEEGAAAGACCVGAWGGAPAVGGGFPVPVEGGEGSAAPLMFAGFRLPLGAPPGLTLTHQSRSVGTPGFPDLPDWSRPLGIHFTLDVFTRIVATANPARAWWITESNTYREFTDPDLDDTFEAVSPSDERSTLRRTVGGWELTKLDGRRILFRPDGRWQEFLDRQGNRTFGTYTERRLDRVDFPDGRSAHLTYGSEEEGTNPSRIVEAREFGVGGVNNRLWSFRYTVAGFPELLTDIGRPDLPDYKFVWNPGTDPTMARWLLVPTAAGVERQIGVWAYLGGQMVRTWRGAASPLDATAYDDYQFSYPSPGVSVVTDPLGQATTYTFEREPSGKPKVTAVTGDCPTCGLGPNSTLTYDDLSNPLRPSSVLDGRNLETVFTYDAHGQMTSRTEAAGTSLARTTTYTYSSLYPALVETISRPSVTGGTNERISTTLYDALGNPESVTETGFEAGAAFSLTTASTFNTQGQPLTFDPPGHDPTGTEREDDLVEFTYDPSRGNLLPLTRTDKTGTTTYFYDAYNRRIGVKDPNGVLTEYRYDNGNRLTQIIQRSADTAVPGDPIVAADLVTTNHYGAYGDLACQILPHNKASWFIYDAGGRLIANVRANVATGTPSATNCVNLTTGAVQHFYVRDKLNRVTREIVQDWISGAWQTVWSQNRVFANRCQLQKTIADPAGPAEAVTEYGYDCNGNLDRLWDANHPNVGGELPTTEYLYDDLDRLSTVKQRWAAGGHAVTGYAYDVQDHLTAVTDAEGSVTSYVYSDRDLMTAELSPVSGATSHAYDEHGQLVTTTDARGVVVTRSYDGLDRVLAVDYPGTGLDTTYTYDDAAVPFSLGRLTAISRDNGLTVPYRYDRFGRTTLDGELSFTHDKGGNRSTIGYPGGVSANFTYDYLDRPTGLTVQVPGQPLQTVASAGSYRVGTGALKALTLGNSLVETRTYDGKNAPAGITVSSDRLAWAYTTDREGNPTAISQTQPAAESRTFGYQDFAYFLTSADGPWGTLAWSYDKIGNRLTQVRNGLAPGDLYTYLPNTATPTPGNSATLDRIDLAVGGTKDYTFGPAGHLERIDESLAPTIYDHTAEGQLGTITRGTDQPAMTYDGRSFLRQATTANPTIFEDGFDTGDLSCWGVVAGGEEGDGPHRGGETCFTPAPAGAVTTSTYGSEGLLYSVEKKASPTAAGTRFHLFYFAGRPVAEVEIPPTGAPTWTYLHTDHLGTPILATRSNNTERWRGGFEPFGTDWRAGTASGASENGVFLRLPGQWVDGVWGEDYYNVHRWYNAPASRFNRADPLAWVTGPGWVYTYAHQRPGLMFDPLGLLPVKCEGCDQLKKAEMNVRRRIFLLRTQGTAFDFRPGAGNTPGATTFCMGMVEGVKSQAVTFRSPEFRFEDEPCAFLCTGVHEKVHRDMCSTLGSKFLDLSEVEAELPAYREDLRCLKTAIRDGQLEIVAGKVVY